MDKLRGLIKKHRYIFAFLMSVIYTSVLRSLSSEVFVGDIPVYILAPLMCIFSLPLTALCLWLMKCTDKKLKKMMVLLSAYLFPPTFWYMVSRAAYVWNSYLGGEFFFSLSLYIGGMDNALWGIGIGAASLITVILYKFFGGKNEDTRNDTK